MQRTMTKRFWAVTTTGAASALLLVLTLGYHEWIEAVFHVDPDRGSGALEWGLVAAFALTALACGFVVRAELMRISPSAAS